MLRVMQRSYALRSSYESAGCSFRAAACVSARFRPASVSTGILPSGGSMMSDVRLLSLPRSIQNSL